MGTLRRVQRRQAEEADQRAGELPRTLPKSQHLETSRAFAKTYRELRDNEAPAKAYLEWRLEQVEDGELQAETMKEVMSREEEGSDPWAIKMKADGTLQIKKGRHESNMPATPEEIRAKYRVMARCWMYIKLRHPGKAYLKDHGLDCWQQHVDWLLGEDVYENSAKDDKGDVVMKTTWSTLLSYEYQVRRKAYALANNQGQTVKEALIAAREDEKTRTKYFTLPTTLMAGAASAAAKQRRRSRTPPRPHQGVDRSLVEQPRQTAYRPAGRGKGTGRGKGRGQWASQWAPGLGWKKGGSPYTPDNRFKCYRYQRGKCDGCDMVHTCYVCSGNHPIEDCPRRPKGAAAPSGGGGKQ